MQKGSGNTNRQKTTATRYKAATQRRKMTTAKRNTLRWEPLSVCERCNALSVGGAFLHSREYYKRYSQNRKIMYNKKSNDKTRRHSNGSLPCGHIFFMQKQKIHVIFHIKSSLSSNLSLVDANSHTSHNLLPSKMATFSFCRPAFSWQVCTWPIKTLTSSTSQTEHIFVFHQRVLFAIDPAGSQFRRRRQVLSAS